jgi:hypothetical protein
MYSCFKARKMANLTIDEITCYWLLTSAIEFPRGLGYLIPVVDGEALNMKDVPGCKSEDYANALLTLYDSGMIEFSSEIPGDDVETRSGISAILDRFLRVSNGDPAVLLRRHLNLDQATKQIVHNHRRAVKFKLTDLGGRAWERIARPAWDHFFDQRSDYETGEMYSRDLTLLVARLGWFSELDDARVDINTIELQTLSGFQVLYWKTLPDVYRATFSLAHVESRWINGRYAEAKWFREWWYSTTKWFTQPWELPDWPA